MPLLSLRDFLLGFPAGPVSAGGNGTSLSSVFLSAVVAGTPDVGQRASAADLFALDEWKVARTFTMSLGIRVEINGQQSEVQGRETNFFPQFYVPPQVDGFTSPDTSGFVLPGNFSGTAPPEVPGQNSTLLDHPTQWQPQPPVSYACLPLSSRDLVPQSRYCTYAPHPP